MKLKLTWLLTLFMAFVMQLSFGQEKDITGTVTAASDGLPLPSVTVLIKGTSIGTSTDIDGKYSIKAKTGDVIVFSFVSMKTTEKTVGSSSTIDVAMADDIASLDEVVITGYATTSKTRQTSAISVVTAEEVQSVPIATFEQLLQGRAAGVEVSSGSGQPGTVANVRIRGVNSINGNNQPLYIVDGIQIDPNSFASLNANDFETFSVLKDAQAKSIYGSRAAAGVIVITTKQGKQGKTNIQYRTYTGWSIAPDPQVDPLNARQFLELSREFGANGAGSLSDQDITDRVNDLDGFNISDALLRTGRTESHEFIISGGNEKTTFYTSAGYFRQEGTVIGSDLQRLTTRVNLTHKASDKFTVGLSTSMAFTRRNFLPSNGGVNLANPFLAPLIGNPVTPVFNDDGTFNTNNGLAFALPNILEQIETEIRDNEEFKLITSANLRYDITDNFSAIYNIGVDYEDDFSVTALNPNSFRGQTLPAITDPAEGLFGSQTENSIRDVNFTSTLQLQYQNTFANKHTVSVSGFVEAVRRDFRSSNFTGFGIDSDLFGFAGSITPGTPGENGNGLIPTVGGARTLTGLFSIFASGSYDYDDRYGFDFGLRRDESSRVAPQNSDEAFYSVGVRWNIDNEAFMEGLDWITSLKLRASFGTSGNDGSVGANAAFQQLNLPLFQGTRGFTRAGLANPNIGWEITEDLNIGLDFGLFNNKINGSFEYYKSETTDLILPFNVSAAFGAGALNANAGSLENEGAELTLNFNLVNKGDWRFSVNANAAYNFGVITDLGQQDQFEFGTFVARVGEQINSQFVVPFAGVNPANGDALYRDLDGNVTDQFSDNFAQTGFGSAIPLYTGGFGFDLGWKGFELSTLFTFQSEVTRFNNTTFFSENLNFLQSGLNQSVTVLRRWQQPGDITDVPRFDVNREFSSQDLEDASFLRFRNITLAYNFSQKTLEGTPFSSIRIYGQGVNVFTFTKFSGLDPEDNNNISQFEFPNPRTFTFGLDIGL